MRCTYLLFLFLLSACSGFSQSENQYTIIPRPAQLQPRPGQFTVSNTTTIMVPFAQAELKTIADNFARQLNQSSGLGITVRNVNKMALPGNLIQFIPSTDVTLGDEAYRLDITDQVVSIEARQAKGFFYAVQTLYQLLPPSALGRGAGGMGQSSGITPAPTPSATGPLLIPACRIEDQPRYVYRGMHLDVCRHFFPVSFIKKYLDLMALHKFNTFHWHLTDDQGWRIEIKKYPKLTQIGSQRRETIVGHYDEYDPQVFDGQPYGGFYTQDEVREVVQYAAARHINVIPEIEMPGHSLAALAAYPELGCSAGPYQVATKWGVFEDVFCPYEKTFTVLQDVLTEVMALFPGPYIHIGGDECPKSTWRKSAYAQQLIKREKLKNENQLQSWFITRIDKFVTSKGRKIIGWDEILEGGLSPNAAVMSWRGTRGGIEAARQRHDVVMTPGTFCYFDHYQADPGQEPTAFGGLVPLSLVYSYNPTPTELNAEQAKHILGAQGNVWTEYIQDSAYVEYMVWPRAAALAEVVWTPLAQKDYTDFTRRLATHFKRLDAVGANYARSLYNVTAKTTVTSTGQLSVSLSTGVQVPAIRYTTDGSVPSGESPQYTAPIALNKTTTIRAVAFTDSTTMKVPMGRIMQKEYLISKATGKPYTLLAPATKGRPDRNNLTDGVLGSMGGYELMDVVSFSGNFSAVVDLGQSQPVQSVSVGFVKYTARNLCLPKQIDIAVSDDGQTYRPVGTFKSNAAEGGKRGIIRLPFEFAPTSARYVRITALNVGRVPAGLRNPGKPAQLAVDEIEVK
ncbi:Beta-N-acetylhexosaminidase [Fibrisoma limi BUZ 3]|uniref:beta-N-acetylhexosaminidase n=1 Tax=Fibrisoma limi BUZ 3 TaxID=1185876 RepID=I2GCT5_9BACT|nr:family 20 glycosylhydrolase [Fibrisoma limi]CCH51709.1 Beta-N-acetylhexosaminidase [Fibrisoma limi BUZ 3]